MQRELRQGQVHRPAQLQHIPVPVTRIYKSVKWWPEAPGDGRIFFKAEHTELNLNFQDQLQQVWDVSISCKTITFNPFGSSLTSDLFDMFA